MSFSGLLGQNLTIYNTASKDRYGREQVGSGTSVNARFQKTSKPTFEYSGRGSREVQYVITGIAYVKSDTTVNEGDKVTYDSINYRVHAISKVVDGTGNVHHKRLELTKWQI